MANLSAEFSSSSSQSFGDVIEIKGGFATCLAQTQPAHPARLFQEAILLADLWAELWGAWGKLSLVVAMAQLIPSEEQW